MDYIISLTNRCNLRCTYCYERKLNTELGSMSDEITDYTINFIKQKNNADIVYLFGGEPLLYKDKIKTFACSIKSNYCVITTNGMLLDEEFIKWCMDNNVMINLSHDGMDCSARGIKTEELNEKLKILLEYQPNTLVQMVYEEKNLDRLAENIMYFKNMGVKKISASMDAFLVPEDMDKFADRMKEEWKKVADIDGMFITQIDDKYKVVKGHKNNKCEVCKRQMFINWDGKIYPCIQFQNNPEFYCGNVKDGLSTAPVIKKHPNYSLQSVRCNDCEIAEYCHNSCACRKMSSTGGLDDISEAKCIEEQVHILTVLDKMVEKKIQ